MTISIPSITSKQIKEYCSINSIDNIEGFCVECLMKGFSIEKFGNSPLDKIKMENGKMYTLIVKGDCSGDGQAELKDILAINKHRLNKASLTAEYLQAGAPAHYWHINQHLILSLFGV